jgi:hypothetical protein
MSAYLLKNGQIVNEGQITTGDILSKMAGLRKSEQA